ncbi:MAG: FliI/YscN family ATPase, partial [Myxococcota bacterium]
MISLRDHQERFQLAAPTVEGQVTRVRGLLLEGAVAGAAVGDLYRILARGGGILAEVVAVDGTSAILMPFGSTQGLSVGDRLVRAGDAQRVQVSESMQGRVLDSLGRPLDNGSALFGGRDVPLHREPLAPMRRAPVNQRMPLNIRSLDAFAPAGRGQRLGIFAGAGVGKSTLLGMIAKNASADVVVLALVGERGREVGHFVRDVLGPALERSVVVVATSDRPPTERIRAAFFATAVAESFRDEGANVLLFVDSLTRVCMAQREIGLAVGEPPTTKGYPPSTFAMLPRLLERAAPEVGGGSITGIYTVLVEGDDLSDPVSDSARSLLDGHIVLSRELAERGRYPAVDVLRSLSRVESQVSEAWERQAAGQVREWLGLVEESKDLIAVGAYKPGADPKLDGALARQSVIEAFLKQSADE